MTNDNNAAMKTPVQALEDRRRQQGDSVAMVQPLGGDQVRRYTWNEVADEAYRMAAYLKAEGIQAGDRVALVSKNCAEWIIADLAIWVAGGVSVPLYPTLLADSVRLILEHSESKLLFVGKLDDWGMMKDGVPEGVKQVAFSLAPDEVRGKVPVWTDIVAKQEPLAEAASPGPDDLATIIYTSGTTGVPKGVMHQYKSMSAVGAKVIQVYNLEPSDRMISYLPLSHVAERAAVEMALLYVGNTVYFAESLDTFGEDI
ncbi:MAG TPA: AMP-binding acetyl-CoA synthetase, partial [Alcanivorax sp.]|nr:AMP-binding acetyl-CoA synthetase [Alcanivorax sp.]